MKKSKKVIVVGAVIASVTLIGCGGAMGYYYYQEQKELERQDQFITSNVEEIYTEVTEELFDPILEMQSNFESQCKEVIEKNTLSDLDIISDKETLKSAINELSELKTIIESEKNQICNEEQKKKFKDTIDDLVVQYEARIETILEEERIAEEERLAAEEAARKAEEERLLAEEERLAEEAAKKAEEERLAKENQKENTQNSNNDDSSYKDPHAQKYSSYEEVKGLIEAGIVTDYVWVECEGLYRYIVGDYSYANDGDIIEYDYDGNIIRIWSNGVLVYE